ncbi:hypothetical protein [Streptomyces caniscabiei]|uniref:ASCH domain-containing protein n=1 Tax=Streptomyces caniscabiei TaxID=2746961 RepID=A0ABU4MYL1_9ACTN|nr:hypothetical protein [Streptomyces caniscabiei]MBE4790271.1 hypothetical protein [Streptomyces caniscabiei]MBE4799500.1 hypothetical protein [Streptomyces caniscabiei]MDX3015128.1 hypothetical protein [Streptomyces caniscabiei]MDX3042571.1 hypothetical protein [Streptomyces caniscabiei]
MRAFTVRQPYTDAIAFGTKRVENRSGGIPAKFLDTWVLLHAAKEPHISGVTPADLADLSGDSVGGWPEIRSAVIAAIRFSGSHEAAEPRGCCLPWGHSRITPDRPVWHWEIAEVTRLAEPVPASGALGFWTPKDNVLEAVHAQLGQVV